MKGNKSRWSSFFSSILIKLAVLLPFPFLCSRSMMMRILLREMMIFCFLRGEKMKPVLSFVHRLLSSFVVVCDFCVGRYCYFTWSSFPVRDFFSHRCLSSKSHMSLCLFLISCYISFGRTPSGKQEQEEKNSWDTTHATEGALQKKSSHSRVHKRHPWRFSSSWRRNSLEDNTNLDSLSSLFSQKRRHSMYLFPISSLLRSSFARLAFRETIISSTSIRL
jgi:hypothetical protein